VATDAGEAGAERVLVALTGHPNGERLVRRAAQLARGPDSVLLGVHVSAEPEPAVGVAAQRDLLASLGGELRHVVASDVAAAVLEVARAERCSQILLGATQRSRWHRLTRGSVIANVVRGAGPIDVHVLSDDGPASAPPPPARRLTASPLSRQRQAAGWVTAVVLLAGLTVLLTNTRGDLHPASVLLLYLLQARAVALVGGALPAVAAAVVGLLLADYYFTAPLYELSVADTEEVVALLVYLAAATIVSVLVDRVARLRIDAARSSVEAEAMAALAGSLAERGALPEVLAHLRATFGLRGVALFRRVSEGWEREAEDGEAPADPLAADVHHEIGDDRVLALSGGPLRASEHRALLALVAQVATAVEAERLQEEARQARELAEANDLRAALLQAVSHDLRSPLAGIKASVSSLRADDVDWTDEDEAEFLRTIEEEADRLDALVANLLDMSRIRAGAVRANLRPVALDEVVPAALAGLGPRAARVRLAISEALPTVEADPVLLERIMANLVDNALNASPPDGEVCVEADASDQVVDVRVVDHGAGIASGDRDLVFAPFQRTADHGTGVGLGLAIVRGFVDALGAELRIADTPGGGATMAVRLPRARADA
jgi:two-component system sensor histidine kinase KdpD